MNTARSILLSTLLALSGASAYSTYNTLTQQRYVAPPSTTGSVNAVALLNDTTVAPSPVLFAGSGQSTIYGVNATDLTFLGGAANLVGHTSGVMALQISGSSLFR